MREVVLGIKGEVEGGSTFASALRKYPQHFDNLFCSLVESGEQSGALETMLDRVAIYKEKVNCSSKNQESNEIPATVIVVAIVVTIILMVKVVPVFQDLFASFEQIYLHLRKWL